MAARLRRPLSLALVCYSLLLSVMSGSALASPAPTAAADTAPPAPPSHIFLIMMENREYGDIIGQQDTPYLNRLANRYTVADQYYAIRHPSLPNYLALISGHTFGIDNDCTDCFQDAPNLVDTLEARGKTWKSYQEDLPGPCFRGESAGQYAIRHDPFLYFDDVRKDPDCCNRVMPLPQLEDDLSTGQVPDFVWITPNLQHDMHDGSRADGDAWLANLVPQILGSDAWKQDGLLIITWDEGTSDDGCCDLSDGGRVPLLVIAANGQRAYHSSTPTTHYSLLRTIEDLWGLDYLGHSGDATVQPLMDQFAAPQAG